MREIKYRAFDKAAQRIREVKSITWEMGFVKSVAVDSGVTLQGETWILMEYTGLKDKNGKEIYERDIVKIIGGDGMYDGESWIVEYDKRKAAFVFTKLVDRVNKSPFIEIETMQHINIELKGLPVEINIIGNTFENPELLK